MAERNSIHRPTLIMRLFLLFAFFLTFFSAWKIITTEKDPMPSFQADSIIEQLNQDRLDCLAEIKGTTGKAGAYEHCTVIKFKTIPLKKNADRPD